MTQLEIQNILKEIKYPGFNRDIVSFGMVKNISLSENTIDISLQINSENEDLLNQLTSEIKNKFFFVELVRDCFKVSSLEQLHIERPDLLPSENVEHKNDTETPIHKHFYSRLNKDGYLSWKQMTDTYDSLVREVVGPVFQNRIAPTTGRLFAQ